MIRTLFAPCGGKGVTALLLASLLSGVSTDSLAKKTYVLGEKQSVTYQVGRGPSKDGTINVTYNAAPTVVFSRNTTLAPANVVLKWDNNHGSGKNSTGAFCTQSSSGTERGFSVQSGFISAGSYNGVDIFKTNIQGLYFSLKLHNFSSANQFTLNVSELNIRNGTQSNVLTPIPSGNWCDKTNTSGSVNYATDGGFAFYNTITFYTDQTYVPGGGSIQLLSSSGYGLRIWNESPGPGIASHAILVTYDIGQIKISEPTCSVAPVASGASVKNNVVDMGRYSPRDILSGATPVPFAIQLTGCRGLNNINVTLTSSSVAKDRSLLANALVNDRAYGVGVQISGAANNYSPQTILVPNDENSVYHDQHDTTGENNIYEGSVVGNEPGVTQSQTLNFLATLKQDSNQPISAGNFKATGIFTMDYP